MKHLKSKTVAAKAKAEPQSNPDRSPTVAPLPVAERRMVAYGLVRPDPGQPRKSFSEASLQELADSIREQGIVQDLVMEFVPANLRILEPDLEDKEYRLMERQASSGEWLTVDRCDEKNIKHCRELAWPVAFGGEHKEAAFKDHYLLVCGERRWRAAGLVGLANVNELERRARGGTAPAAGGLPDEREPRNRV